MKSLISISLFLLLIFKNTYVTSAAHNFPEEGFRWKEKFILEFEGEQLSFDELHNQLKNQDLENKIKEADEKGKNNRLVELEEKLRTEGKSKEKIKEIIDKEREKQKNVAYAAVSIIFENRSAEPKTFIISKPSNRNIPRLFLSGISRKINGQNFDVVAFGYFNKFFSDYSFLDNLHHLYATSSGIKEEQKEYRITEADITKKIEELRDQGLSTLIMVKKRDKDKEYDMWDEVNKFKGQSFFHSEQFIRLYFLKDPSITPFIKSLIEPRGTKIRAIIIHIHSLYDLCERCTETWALDLNGEGAFTNILNILREQGYDVSNCKKFLFASSRLPYKASRCGVGLDENYHSPISFEGDVHFFQKKLEEVDPHRNWNKFSEEKEFSSRMRSRMEEAYELIMSAVKSYRSQTIGVAPPAPQASLRTQQQPAFIPRALMLNKPKALSTSVSSSKLPAVPVSTTKTPVILREEEAKSRAIVHFPARRRPAEQSASLSLRGERTRSREHSSSRVEEARENFQAPRIRERSLSLPRAEKYGRAFERKRQDEGRASLLPWQRDRTRSRARSVSRIEEARENFQAPRIRERSLSLPRAEKYRRAFERKRQDKRSSPSP